MTSTIGNVDLDTGTVTIYPLPKAATHQDGLKVDTVSRVQVISPFQGHTFNTTVPATFIGTDDENYGWTLPQDPAAILQTWSTRRRRPRSSALANDGGPGAPSGARP